MLHKNKCEIHGPDDLQITLGVFEKRSLVQDYLLKYYISNTIKSKRTKNEFKLSLFNWFIYYPLKKSKK